MSPLSVPSQSLSIAGGRSAFGWRHDANSHDERQEKNALEGFGPRRSRVRYQRTANPYDDQSAHRRSADPNRRGHRKTSPGGAFFRATFEVPPPERRPGAPAIRHWILNHSVRSRRSYPHATHPRANPTSLLRAE